MKKNLLVIMIIMLIFPSFVYALDNTVTVKCDTANKKNDIVKCSIKGTTTTELSALEYSFILDEYSTVDKFEKDSSFEGSYVNDIIYLYRGENVEGEFNVGTLFLKVSKKNHTPEVKHKKLIFYDGDYKKNILEDNKEDVNTKEKNTHIKSNTSKKILICGIIILIVGVCVVVIYLRYKSRSCRHE